MSIAVVAITLFDICPSSFNPGVITQEGVVTLTGEARSISPRRLTSDRSDDLTPCLHGRGPEGSVRACLDEMALDVEGILCRCLYREKSLRGSDALESLHLP